MRGRNVSVSVILPTYNRAALLPRSVQSVLEQTHGDLELLVIDDGSQDDTMAIVSRFKDDRIRYLKLAQNHGLAFARNKGLDAARGTYLAFQDSDDEWHTQKLERQICALEANPEVAVVYSDMHRMYANGAVMYHRSPSMVRGRLVNPETLFWQSYMLAMQPVLMRRACMTGLRFDEGLAMFEDLDLHLRVAQRYEFLHMKEPLMKYYETQGLTADRHRELKARRQLVTKYARLLIATEPVFMIKEALDVLLRKSLLPIVNQHMTEI